MTAIEVTTVEFGSPAYDATVALRHAVLRAPLGLDFPTDELAAEAQDQHVACFVDGTLAGCLMLVRKSDDTVQMRQVAVAFDRQGQGIGRALVEFAEQLATSQGYTTMMLHARATAVPFYLKLNYTLTSEEFTVVTLPHFAMQKKIGTGTILL